MKHVFSAKIWFVKTKIVKYESRVIKLNSDKVFFLKEPEIMCNYIPNVKNVWFLPLQYSFLHCQILHVTDVTKTSNFRVL